MLADRVEHYANVARDVEETLSRRGEPQAAAIVNILAGRASDAARYLRTHDGTALWSDVQYVARDKGWLLAGAGFLGGLAAARAVRTARAFNGGWEHLPSYVDAYAPPSMMRDGDSYGRS